MRNGIRAIGDGMRAAHWNANVEAVERWGRAVEAIERPVTDDEAVVLMNALPRDEDDCFGLAWTLLHACETAPVTTQPWCPGRRSPANGESDC